MAYNLHLIFGGCKAGHSMTFSRMKGAERRVALARRLIDLIR
jgi:hypothetical protein